MGSARGLRGARVARGAGCGARGLRGARVAGRAGCGGGNLLACPLAPDVYYSCV